MDTETIKLIVNNFIKYKSTRLNQFPTCNNINYVDDWIII